MPVSYKMKLYLSEKKLVVILWNGHSKQMQSLNFLGVTLKDHIYWNGIEYLLCHLWTVRVEHRQQTESFTKFKLKYFSFATLDFSSVCHFFFQIVQTQNHNFILKSLIFISKYKVKLTSTGHSIFHSSVLNTI